MKTPKHSKHQLKIINIAIEINSTAVLELVAEENISRPELVSNILVLNIYIQIYIYYILFFTSNIYTFETFLASNVFLTAPCMLINDHILVSRKKGSPCTSPNQISHDAESVYIVEYLCVNKTLSF